jgi:hypothetical protein
MSEHGISTEINAPTTPEALLADRQRFWSSFASAILASVITAVVVLVGMAVFLL